MINVTELRIGNWCLKLNKQHQVTPSDISTAGDDGGIDYLTSIPLTPEIFNKTVFENLYDYYSIRIDEYIWLRIYKDGRYGFWSDSVENVCNFEVISQDNRIEYLHQLQNLYYTHTKMELIIELL